MRALGAQGAKKLSLSFILNFGLLAALDAVYKSWTGHFSISGYALGMLIVIISYGWFALNVMKAMKYNQDVSETQRQAARRSLILTGVTCLIFVPTLSAFIVPP